MNEKINIDFCFKGNRQYVHGTDIYTKLLELQNSDIKKIDIAFHGIALHNMTFSPVKSIVDDIKVTFRCMKDDKKIILFGVENNKDVDCRYEYKEEKIIENSIVISSAESILLERQTEYSFIEHIVAMNKALVESLYSDADGKWYFTRLQLKEPINMSNVASLKLILKSNFQLKLTKSAIIVNEIEVGFIYFSLIPKES